MSKSVAKQQGFTIVELMIAIVIFSTVLTIVVAGIIQIGRIFSRATTMSRTQELSRSIIEDITRSIQLTSAYPLTGVNAGNKLLCIGNTKYEYREDVQSGDTPETNFFWKGPNTEVNTCNAALDKNNSEVGGLLQRGMVLLDFPAPKDLVAIYGTNAKDAEHSLWDVSLTIGFDNGTSSLDMVANKCKPRNQGGSEFCGVSTISTTVEARLVSMGS